MGGHGAAAFRPAGDGSHGSSPGSSPGSSLADVTDTLPSLHEIIETATFRAGFNTNMVILGTALLGLAAGVIGVFMLLRKRSMTTDALSHATLPGIVIAFLVAERLGFEGRSLPVLLLGAAVTGVLGVVCIQAILRHSRLREDAAIGIVLSVFFGAGIVGLSYVQANAPSGSGGLNTFIYGQAATLGLADVALMGGIAAAGIVAALLLLKEFTLVCFNDAFARVDGWQVRAIDLAMLGLVVLVTVAGLQAVGLVLVVAMLIIPAVAARFWTDRLWVLIIAAGAIGASSGYLGSVLSALLPRKPAGAVIVLTAGAFFVVSFVGAPKRGVLAASARRLGLTLRIAGDHLLEAGHEAESEALSKNELRQTARERGWSAALRVLVVLWLRRARLVTRTAAGGLRLTAGGLERGERVARNHALWEQYLISHADVAPSHVDWSVDQVEHVLSEDLVRELEAELSLAAASSRADNRQRGGS